MPDNKNPENIRHSFAHLLAATVLDMYPGTKNTIGPAIENGFYYDFHFPFGKDADERGHGETQMNADRRGISEQDLPKIQKRMREILKGWQKDGPWFRGEEVSAKEAKKKYQGNEYKEELIEEIEQKGEEITLYTSGQFTDLCRGGHAENAKDLNPEAFWLTHLAGAYWRGDEKNKMLTRIYGVAFETKEELDAHLKMLEEAKKRDHKKLGPELDLFVFSPLVGPGLPLWTPKGTMVRNLLDSFVWELREARGYERVDIPHLAKKDLYETSGHWEKFAEDLFKVETREGHLFAIKPMNCPHHTQIYNRKKWSYRDLPQRYASTTKVYRDEQSGELAGLSRVRSITQDDAHTFCRMDQAADEAEKIWEIIHSFYGAFGIDLKVRLSLRDPKAPEKYLGGDKLWNQAEQLLRDLVRSKDSEAIEAEGEAAFYGPKVDFMGRDAIGREHQVATIQLDFNQPERFNLHCINENGEEERIVMIHAAIMGSIERFMALLIEHYAGAFPLWLAPVQARVLAVSDKFQEYGKKVAEQLRTAGLRAELADANETLGKRIRAAEIEKIPYILVVGEKEMQAKSVAVRHYKRGDEGAIELEALIEKLQKEISEKRA